MQIASIKSRLHVTWRIDEPPPGAADRFHNTDLVFPRRRKSLLRTDLAQDVRDLRQLQPWHVSEVISTTGPGPTCEIANLSSYHMLCLDLQLAPEVSDRDANSRTNVLDRKVTAFLASRGWPSVKIAGN